jgi:diacylglycerol kinase (ATP)
MKYMNSRIRSFKYAIQGISQAVSQPNMQIHLVVAVMVIIAGFVFKIARTEWMLVVFAIGMVLAAECMNTALEKLTDLVSPGHNELAGKVKDMAAGAVLICAAAAAIIGLIVFIPKIVEIIY